MTLLLGLLLQELEEILSSLRGTDFYRFPLLLLLSCSRVVQQMRRALDDLRVFVGALVDAAQHHVLQVAVGLSLALLYQSAELLVALLELAAGPAVCAAEEHEHCLLGVGGHRYEIPAAQLAYCFGSWSLLLLLRGPVILRQAALPVFAKELRQGLGCDALQPVLLAWRLHAVPARLWSQGHLGGLLEDNELVICPDAPLSRLLAAGWRAREKGELAQTSQLFLCLSQIYDIIFLPVLLPGDTGIAPHQATDQSEQLLSIGRHMATLSTPATSVQRPIVAVGFFAKT
eukprot:TRINITY_DN41754_c0_g1_i2.p1 TRINITY_DN41754_c0_g1~~TRINITY_DN41754_c0_g1_i2.p1  ORF type:complete len:287 (+),score=20.40 TRINITY_DN41754_c0_g1_i2:557-1417(+)